MASFLALPAAFAAAAARALRLGAAGPALPTLASALSPSGALRAASGGPAAGGSGSGGPSASAASPPSSLPAERPELVDAYLSPANKDRPGQRKAAKAAVVAAFQRYPGDVGSSEVQAALLTARLRAMEEHFKVHRKDVHARRTLAITLNRRRALLAYLRRSDFARYSATLHRLGLKDAYAPARHDDAPAGPPQPPYDGRSVAERAAAQASAARKRKRAAARR